MVEIKELSVKELKEMGKGRYGCSNSKAFNRTNSLFYDLLYMDRVNAIKSNVPNSLVAEINSEINNYLMNRDALKEVREITKKINEDLLVETREEVNGITRKRLVSIYDRIFDEEFVDENELRDSPSIHDEIKRTLVDKFGITGRPDFHNIFHNITLDKSLKNFAELFGLHVPKKNKWGIGNIGSVASAMSIEYTIGPELTMLFTGNQGSYHKNYSPNRLVIYETGDRIYEPLRPIVLDEIYKRFVGVGIQTPEDLHLRSRVELKEILVGTADIEDFSLLIKAIDPTITKIPNNSYHNSKVIKILEEAYDKPYSVKPVTGFMNSRY